MNAFLELLEAGGVLVADGATGTNLQEMGLQAGAHTEEWVLEHPDRIVQLEKAFIDAGAQIILTCTFGGTAPRLRGSKFADEVSRINLQAAALAREAAASGRGVLVGGSMGPLGQLLRPYGPITYEDAVGAYAAQARALAEGGVDLLVIETQFHVDEARAALEGVRLVSELPAVVSFSYDRGTRTMMGVKPEVAASTIGGLGAAMIGVNCGTTLENARTIVEQYAAAFPTLPIWVKPNAGMPRTDGTKTYYDVRPDQMADFARAAAKLGARVVGGCCGSTPEHVRAIATALQEAQRTSALA